MNKNNIDILVLDRSTLNENGIAIQSLSYALAVAGNRGKAVAGEGKTVGSVAITGDCGESFAGEWGAAIAGSKGCATVGSNSVAYAGKGGVATGGDGAIAVVLQNLEGAEKAVTRDNGVAFCGIGGTAEVREKSVAIGFNKTKAKASEGSIVILRYNLSNDPKNPDFQFHIGVVGCKNYKVTQNLIPNYLYTLDESHNFLAIG